MSRSTKSKSTTDKQMDGRIEQFVAVTGLPPREARRYIEKYNRLEVAIDAYYNDPLSAQTVPRNAASTSKLGHLFDQYKDPDGEEITADGTIRFCADLGVDPEDVVLLAVAYDLKSPRMGEWSRKGWVDGWKALGCDSISAMKSTLPRLRDKLGSDPEYFRRVYNFTFDFSRPAGQRSLGLDMAEAFWALLIPHGLRGGALSHLRSGDGEEEGAQTAEEEGWKEEYTQWWFDFLNEKGGRGVSKDTWQMFLDFVRTIDGKFEKYDTEAAWPSTLDDFVGYAKKRLASGAA